MVRLQARPVASLVIQGLPDYAAAVRAHALLAVALGPRPPLMIRGSDDNYEIWATNCPDSALSSTELHAQVFGALCAFVVGDLTGYSDLDTIALALGAQQS